MVDRARRRREVGGRPPPPMMKLERAEEKRATSRNPRATAVQTMPEIEAARPQPPSSLIRVHSVSRPPFHERRLPLSSAAAPADAGTALRPHWSTHGRGWRRPTARGRANGRRRWTSRKKKWGEIRQHEIVFASDIQGRTGSAHTLDTHIEGATGTPRKIRGGRSPGRGWGPLATPVGLGHAELGRGPCRRGAFSAPRVQKADGRTDAGGRTADGRTDRVVVVFPL